MKKILEEFLELLVSDEFFTQYFTLQLSQLYGGPKGNRTLISALRGQRPNR